MYAIVRLVLYLFGMYLQKASAWAGPEEHHVLLGKSSMSTSGISTGRCSARFLSRQRCFSYIDDPAYRVDQMNNATRDQSRDCFRPILHLSYYDKPSIDMQAVEKTPYQSPGATSPISTAKPNASTSKTLNNTTIDETSISSPKTSATTSKTLDISAVTPGISPAAFESSPTTYVTSRTKPGTSSSLSETVLTPRSYTVQTVTVSTHRVSTEQNIDASCMNRLGLEDGSIPDENITASSSFQAQRGYTGISTPAGSRLNKIPPDEITMGAWQPAVKDTNQWIQVDLGSPTYVTGVLMQGRQDHSGQWVTKYKVQYQPPSQTSLIDVKDQLGQTQVFDGNINKLGIVESCFYEPILTINVRIVPLEWHKAIALRFELLGCKQ